CHPGGNAAGLGAAPPQAVGDGSAVLIAASSRTGGGPPGFSVARALAERRAAQRTAPETGRACGRARGAGSQAARSEAALEIPDEPGCAERRGFTEPARALFRPRPQLSALNAFFPQDRQNRVKRCGALAHQLD